MQFNFYTKKGDTHDYHYISAPEGVKADAAGGVMLLMRDESFFAASAATMSINQDWHGMHFEDAVFWNAQAVKRGIIFG